MSLRLEQFHPDAVLATGQDGASEPLLDIDEIQGHILPGFGTKHQLLLGLRSDESSGSDSDRRCWLRQLTPYISSLRQVHQVREVRRAVARAQGERPQIPDVLVSVSLAFPVLEKLGLETSSTLDPLFRLGMSQTVNILQDPIDDNGHVIDWKLGHTPELTPDILLTLGSDDSGQLQEIEQQLAASLASSGFRRVYRDSGDALPNSQEHFGFRDAISQPAVRGRLSVRADHLLSRRYLAADDPRSTAFARPGQALIWPGQFVFGYPTQVEGQPDVPGPIAIPPLDWMRNGSFLVFRRLRQDVKRFRRFSNSQADEISRQIGRRVTPAKLQAWIVGRWTDGTPLMRNPDGPDSVVSSDIQQINFFSYKSPESDAIVIEQGTRRTITGTPADLLGARCPHFAHVRKVNNRGATDLGELSRFLLLRRGIPYGPPYTEGEETPIDRGLLFLAYMRSLRDQFLILSRTWMNSATAPEENGHDLLVGQNRSGRMALRVIDGQETIITAAADDIWVIPTGGAYLFTPGISVLSQLSD